MFYNFFIPGGIGGDAYKVYLLNKNFGWSAKKLPSSLFNDRLSGLLAICVLILVFSFNLLEAKFFPILFVLLVVGFFFTYFLTKKLFSIIPKFFLKLFLLILVQILQVISFIFLLKSLDVRQFHHLRSSIFGKFCAQFNFFCRNWSERNALLQASKWFSFQPEISGFCVFTFTMITAFFFFFE